MSKEPIRLDTGAGSHISTVASKAVALVTDGAPSVSFEFNEIEIVVSPGMTEGDVVRSYDVASAVRHAAYIATPAYKERQRQAEEEDRRKTAARKVALAKAPASMSLRDPEGWAKACAANTDGYGGAVMTFAERWARIMESKIADGSTVAGCADDAVSLADEEGITGFMYGCAVSVLAAVWKHGEELRRWHNKETQIGTEGDKANESGGVLNPALLSIG